MSSIDAQQRARILVNTSGCWLFARHKKKAGFPRPTRPLSASGELAPVVDTVLPMSELMRAHEMVDERTHFGKVILVNELN